MGSAPPAGLRMTVFKNLGVTLEQLALASRSSLFDPAKTIKELLCSADWGLVDFRGTFQQLKTPSELRVQRPRIVTNDVQAATLGRAFRPKGGNNYMSTELHRRGDALNERMLQVASASIK